MYCSYADLLNVKSITEILDLVNDENAPYNVINLEDENNICRKRIDNAVKSADAEIDGWLGHCLALPLPGDTPLLIKLISRSIALEILYLRRLPSEIPSSVKNDAVLKRNMLKDIASGLINIGTESVNTDLYKCSKEHSDKIFNRKKLDEY